MDVADALDLFSSYELLLAVAGLAFLAVAVLPRFLHDKPLTVPMVMLALGYLVFSLPLGFDPPDPIAQGPVTVRLTEVGVILSLMAAGLTIDRAPGLRAWSSTWRLLVVTMPLTVAAVALLGVWAGLAPAAAVLLGAAVAPTDPVQGKDVEVGAPLEGKDDAESEEHDITEAGEEDEVRFALSSEAGLNDGYAFPFTNLAVAMALAGTAAGNWFVAWATVDVAYKLVVGCGAGWLLGKAIGPVLLRVPADSDLSRSVTGLGAVASTFFVYGLTEYVGGYGFFAVFIAAVMIRGTDRGSDRHRELQGVVESAERILMAVITGLFGGAVAGGLLDPLGWRDVVLAVALLLVVRPLTAAVALVGLRGGVPWRDRAAISFFGIRGIATFYYLAYALEKAPFPGSEQLWATAGLVVLLSVVVHGVTAGPVIRRLDRRRDSSVDDTPVPGQ